MSQYRAYFVPAEPLLARRFRIPDRLGGLKDYFVGLMQPRSFLWSEGIRHHTKVFFFFG